MNSRQSEKEELMNGIHPLREIVDRNRSGEHIGMYSVCSSSSIVIRAALRDAAQYDYPVIIESTANQVNQDGGYTGMQPGDFVSMVMQIAKDEHVPNARIILGGDHLGPLTWTDKNESEAMALACDLVRSYTLAGYTKIHLDTSMKVKDDPDGRLDPHVCARRGAELACVVNEAFESYHRINPNAIRPVLIVGSEVPIPGGSQEHENTLTPTDSLDFLEQVDIFRNTFKEKGLDFGQVVAFVVQPGVEFGDDFVIQYDRPKALKLMSALKQVPGIVFEGHSTDYQINRSLYDMVSDGVGILKVGPAFTFRLREALLLLEEIERIICTDRGKPLSVFKDTLLADMADNPRYWKKYYQGTLEEITFKKLYSYSDRCRYYLPDIIVQKAIDTLFYNLDSIPEVLLSQYFPIQYKHYMEHRIENDALSVAIDYVQETCHDYAVAAGLCR